MIISKEQLTKDIQGMEKVMQEYLGQRQQIEMQKAQIDKAIEQQSGGIQYARHLLMQIESEGEDAVVVGEKAAATPEASPNGTVEATV